MSERATKRSKSNHRGGLGTSQDDVDPIAQSPEAARLYQAQKATYNALKEKKKKLEEEKKELEEEKEAWRSLSLGRLLQRPPEVTLKLNCSRSSPTVNSDYKDASSRPFRRNVKLEVYNGKTDLFRVGSCILVQFYPRGKKKKDVASTFEFRTKADIERLVSLAISDAIQLAEAATGKRFSQRAEYSLWSKRPDHLVVCDAESYDPIIVVNYEKPFQETKISSGSLLGQVFDNLMQLRRHGQSAPFAVLTTFEHSWLFCQSDEESERLVAEEMKILSVKNMFATPPTKTSSEDDDDRKKPGRSVFRECSRDNLVQSERYENKELVSLLFTAILCALARNPSVPQHWIVDDHKSFCGIALRLDEDGYEWGELSYNGQDAIRWQVKGPNSSMPDECMDCKEGTYFVIKTLDRGDTDVVFQAYDCHGGLHAVKVHLERHNEEDKGEELCKLEVERLIQFYPFFDEKNVKFQKLHTFPCVIMPCLEPIPRGERNSDMVKNGVRQCLEMFAKGGFRYNEYNVCWRHIASFRINKNDTKVVMVNLAQLEEGPVDVHMQVETLMERQG